MDVFPVVVVGSAVAAESGRRASDYGACLPGLILRSLVGILFGASAVVFQLVVCEVLQWINPESRAHLWKASTGTLLGLLGFVVPGVLIARYAPLGAGRRPLGWVILYIAYLAAFHYAGLRLPVERIPEGMESLSAWQALRQDLLACISCVGITAMALLCGVSSVSAPYTAFISDRGPPTTDADVQRIAASLQGTEELISDRQLQINRARLDSSTSRAGSTTNLVGKLFGALSKHGAAGSGSGSNDSRLRALQVEYDALVRLRQELVTDCEGARQRVAHGAFLRTPLGRIHRVIYCIFASYCVYRLANGYARMTWWFFGATDESREAGGGPRDALVMALAAFAARIYPQLDAHSWMRIIGVFMSGAVFVAALSGVLRTVYRLQRSFRSFRRSSVATAATSTGFDPLVVAGIVGVYVLSIATTLRLNLPKDMSGPVTAALASPLRVSSVQLWNDTVLCSSSSVMLVLLYVSSHIADSEFEDIEAQIEKYD